jgi:hypothetical protein
VYDFDYSKGTEGAPADLAAELQAGYGTLGTPGHVFKVQIALSGNVLFNVPIGQQNVA